MDMYVIVNEFTGQKKAGCHSVFYTYTESSSFKKTEKKTNIFLWKADEQEVL